ncbi:MAG: hypothetical protein J6V44_11560 [Methanobrevibacter sp.]|nr:hypothetical protein [Methanobrevibacter sp.]
MYKGVTVKRPWYLFFLKPTVIYKSEFRYFKYIKGKKYSNEIFVEHHCAPHGKARISLGFHSFQTPPEDDYVQIQKDFGVVLVRCIIPKGSLVYYGKINDSGVSGIVSNQIIIEKEI